MADPAGQPPRRAAHRRADDLPERAGAGRVGRPGQHDARSPTVRRQRPTFRAAGRSSCATVCTSTPFPARAPSAAPPWFAIFSTLWSRAAPSAPRTIAEIRLVPRFARHLHELDPASAAAGNAASAEQLRAVSAALLTAGDAMVRASEVSPGSGVGLRGGTFSVRETHGAYQLTLRELRWTEDLVVSGTVEFPRRQGPAQREFAAAGR